MSHVRKLKSAVILDPDGGNGPTIQYYQIIKAQEHPAELVQMLGDLKKSELVGVVC